MYTIAQYEDIKIFQPDKEALQLCSPQIKIANQKNEKYLIDNPQPAPETRITGSFIYAHGPNYPGRSTHHWSKEQWRKLFFDFRSYGLDTAVFQAALWNELNECYYKSSSFKDMTYFNVIEPMLEAAKDENIRVFLGGYGSVSGWSKDSNKKMAEKEAKNQEMCFKELLDYRGLFEGFYFAPETAYMGVRNLEKENFLNFIYRFVFEKIKEFAPDLSIMASPGTKYFPDKNEDMIDALLAIYNGVPIDIIAPQDSVGTCMTLLENQKDTYSNWARVCESLQVELWANIEIFERVDLTRTTPSVTASAERVAAQINHAAPRVKKLICWEAPYFLFSEMGSGLRHKLFNNQYCSE